MHYFHYKEIKESIEYMKATTSELSDIVNEIKNNNTDMYTARKVAQIEYELQTKLEELEQKIDKLR